jgi:hypothetical protein
MRSSFKQTTIKGNDGKDVSVVKVRFDVNPAVENGLYTYLTKV